MAAPSLTKPHSVTGHNLVFREATPADAQFIVTLRTDETKRKHISPTSADVQRQTAWLEAYAKDTSQIYFIIMDQAPVGTVRLYDTRQDSICWGSWVLKSGVPISYALESALMVYHFARTCGFTKAHFDVRRENKSVWKFHERFGAERTSETELNYYYRITSAAITRSLDRYAKYLPDGITII